jgi:sugar phosphate isomerase/epimerase
MNNIKGPGIFLAQFLRDEKPYNTLENIGKWAANLGFTGVQIPTWDSRVFDLEESIQSKSYREDMKGKLENLGLSITELSAHLQGQMLVVHPAYELAFQEFYPKGLGKQERIDWAGEQLVKTITASAKMGLSSVPVLSGGSAWHMMYPWPQRPQGLIEEAFDELCRQWFPILNVAKEYGISIAFELHPGSDLFDGATFEMFLDKLGNHPAACLTYDPSHFLLQQMDYLQFIEIFGERITSFHVKDAEFNPTGKVGVYGGYQPWIKRAGRFRSLGDGQVNFNRIFSLLTEYGFDGWAVLEWECCIKSPEQGAKEAAPFIKNHIIEVTEVAFDDFAGGKPDVETNRKILGLDEN